MISHRQPSIWSIARDFLVLALLLAVANALLDRTDPGWLLLNPTPWILPGVLLGLRYGFTAGLSGALATVALILGSRYGLLDEEARESLRTHAYFFLGLSLAGALAGEAGTRLSHRRHRLHRDVERLRDDNIRLLLQAHLLDETRHQLQQQLALFNAPLCSLDDDLKKLFSYPAEQFEDQLLRLLHRSADISSASIYHLTGNRLQRLATLHPTLDQAETLHLSRTPIAERAAETGTLVSVHAATDLTTTQPYLAAFPWVDHQRRACILLVQDMPLQSYHLQQLARIELILSWASAMASLQLSYQEDGAVRAMPTKKFKLVLTEAFETDRRHGLPSTLLAVKLPAHATFATLATQLPETAIGTMLPDERSTLVLLPFMSQTGASSLAHSLAQSPSLAGMPMPELYAITGDNRVEELWQSLTQGVAL